MYNNKTSATFGIDYTAAALIAMDHFNQKDPTVVPQLLDIANNCTVNLTTLEVADTAWDPDQAVYETIVEASTNPAQAKAFGEELPCVFLGPATEETSRAVATTTSALKIPQMVFNVAAGDLLSVDAAPSTVGVSLNLPGQARGIVEYLQRPGLERDYLAIISWSSTETMDLSRAIEGAGRALKAEGRELKVITVTVSKAADLPEEEVFRRTVQQVQRTGINTIFLNIRDTAKVVRFSEILDEYGMLKNDVVYMLHAGSFPVDYLNRVAGTQEANSPLDRLLTGALIFDVLDGFRYKKDDRFLQAWRSVDQQFIDRLNALIPEDSGIASVSLDYFQNRLPSVSTSFVYDAVMTIGFGGCVQEAKGMCG